MKQVVFTIVFLTIVPAVVSAQTQSRPRLSPDSLSVESSTVRNRVVGPKASNHADNKKIRPDLNAEVPSVLSEPKPAWGNTAIATRPEQTSPVVTSAKVATSVPKETSAPRNVVSMPAATGRAVGANVSPSPVASLGASANYIVGAGDVLDIRLANMPARESTLFTVFKNGTIEYPLLNGPLAVAGMSTDEIARLLSANIKVIKLPRVNVTIRDYASHAVVISGLVDSPGKKVLRRQAMPLYALLAEAAIRPEATTVTIIHDGKEGFPLSLKDDQAMAALVVSGDTIRVAAGSAAPSQFIYLAGDVAAPGEKPFRAGVTLTQTIIAAGVNLSAAKSVKIARRNPSGLLTTVEYDVNSIAQGKTPDPQIIAGDRIEVKRAK